MTEEMAQWFDDNGGRVTRAVFRDAILNGSDVYDTVRQGDYLR